MPDLSAETAYLFRHALLREAAYQLQLPADRSALHGLALELCETILGDSADEIAPELARHAYLARQGRTVVDGGHLQRRELYWTDVAMKQARARYDGEAEITYALGVIESGVATGRQRCEASYNRANTLQRLGRWKEATAEFTRLGELAKENEHPVHEGHAIYGLGYIDWLSGRVDECDRKMDEWIEFTRATNDEHELASAMLALATMRFHRGEVGRALKLFTEWLPRLRKTADEDTLARHLFNYAIVLQESGHFGDTESHYRQALELVRKTGKREYESSILGSLGSFLKQRGELDDAFEYINRAVAIAREVGNRHGRAIHLSNLGTLLQLQNRTREALDCYEEAAREALELGAQSTYASAVGNIGLACLSLGRLNEAAVRLRDAAAMWSRLKDVAWEAYMRTSLARVLRMSGDYDGASEQVARAEELLDGTEGLVDLFMVRGERAHLALARGESAEPEHAACREIYERLGEAYAVAAGKDVTELEAAMQAARDGQKLIHGARREALGADLLKAIEG